MQSGRLWLTGIMVAGSIGILAGCSAAPKHSAKADSVKVVKPVVKVTTSDDPKVINEYLVKNESIAKQAEQVPAVSVARALPLPKRVNTQQLARQTAEQNRLKQLRRQRQQEWEAKQLADAKRAEYHRKWEQDQAQAKARQAAAQAEAQRLAYQQTQARVQAQQASYQQAQQQQLLQAKREQYHRKWEQTQAQQQYQQQARQTQLRQQQARQQQVARRSQQVVTGYGGRGTGNYQAANLSGDFSGNRQLINFVEKMVARHGFGRGYLYGVFSRTRNRDSVARLWAGNNGGKSSGRGWYNYRSKFVTPANIQKGEQFWRQYRPHLMRASQRYGVDPEYIVGIMGVETRWGRILGKHKVIDALTTSAIVNKRRSRFFFKELENYLLMTRSERMDPLQPKGSYAGAMGYGQFMPSSFRAFAVDFNGDGVRDLWNPVDAIGSVANYFAKHGWKRGQEVAVPAKVTSMAYTRMPDGYKVKYSRSRLAKKGIRPHDGRWSRTGRTHLLALTTVPGGAKEPWIGYHNFYVITRYNHSNYYAMAVHQLARAVLRRVDGGQYASR